MAERVVVAMSGGVDSAVAAALLVHQGYEVVGITLNVWPTAPEEEEMVREDACCSLAAVEDARRVAERLGIPHYTLNFREVFAGAVIADFAAEYCRGRTPNPCIRCNERVKFGALLQRARELEASHLATGHYARLAQEEGRHRLYRAADRNKDQTYMLYSLSQDQLAATLLPLGDYTKARVRRMARQAGLPVAERPESQEICFVTQGDYREFLGTYYPEVARPGSIVDTQGNVIGEHRGIAFYTIGQRRGLGIAGRRPAAGSALAGRAVYVVGIRPESNTVVVGPEEALWSDALVAEHLNLVGLAELPADLPVTAKVRYRSPEAEAILHPLEHGAVEVRFRQPQRAITPGQAAVFYQGEMLVGGATISHAGPADGSF